MSASDPASTAHKYIMTPGKGNGKEEEQELIEGLNALAGTNPKMNFNDISESEKLLATAVKAHKMVPLLQSNIDGVVDLSQPQGVSIALFALRDHVFGLFMQLKHHTLPNGQMRIKGDLPIGQTIGKDGDMLIRTALEEGMQLRPFEQCTTGSIAIDAAFPSSVRHLTTNKSLSLAAQSLYHQQFHVISISPKVTGTIDLSSREGKLCSLYAIETKQIDVFFQSPKVTGKLNINATVDLTFGTSQTLVTIAQRCGVLSKFLTTLIETDQDDGDLDLGAICFNKQLLIEHLTPEDAPVIMRFVQLHRLHITCKAKTDQLIKTQEKLCSFGFGDKYFEFNAIFNPGTSAEQTFHSLQPVKGSELETNETDMFSKLPPALSDVENIYYLLTPTERLPDAKHLDEALDAALLGDS